MSDMKSGVGEEDGDVDSVRDMGILELKLDVLEFNGLREEEDKAGEDSESVTVDETGDVVVWRKNLFFISSMASIVGAGLPDSRRGFPNTEDEAPSGSSGSGLRRRSKRQTGLGLPSARP